MNTDAHHDECKLCGQQFLGFTDADLLQHYKEYHSDVPADLKDRLELNGQETVQCNNCRRHYTTFGGQCPFCIQEE